MESCDIGFSADGGEVHLLTALGEQGIEETEPAQGIVRTGEGKRVETLRKNRFELFGHCDLRHVDFFAGIIARFRPFVK
jgi:hypothetical protein